MSEHLPRFDGNDGPHRLHLNHKISRANIEGNIGAHRIIAGRLIIDLLGKNEALGGIMQGDDACIRPNHALIFAPSWMQHKGVLGKLKLRIIKTHAAMPATPSAKTNHRGAVPRRTIPERN